MRFFYLMGSSCTRSSLDASIQLAETLKNLLGSSNLVVGKSAIAQQSCCDNNPREDDALQDVDRFAGPRAPAAAGGVVDRSSSFVHKPHRTASGR